MTIEIQKPELEALIRERMKSGGFQNVEDVLLEALKSSAFANSLCPPSRKRTLHSSSLNPLYVSRG